MGNILMSAARIKINVKEIYPQMLFMLLTIGMNVFAYSNSLIYKIIIVVVDLSLIAVCDKRIKIETYHVSLMLFILWCTLSMFWSEYEIDIKTIFTLLYCLATTAIIHQYLNKEDRCRMLMKFIIVSAYIMACMMIAHFGLSAMLTSRVNNEVVNTNRAGTIFAVSFFFCLYLFYKEKRVLHFAVAIPLVFFVLMSGSKSALVIMAVSAFTLVSLKDGINSSRMIRNMIIGIILLCIVLILITKVQSLYNVIGARFIEFIEVITGKREVLVGRHSIYMRLTMIQYGVRGFIEKPIKGYGLGTYQYYGPWPGSYSHANYIEIGFNLGSVGMILYYWPCFTLIKYLRRLRGRIDKLLRAFLIAYLMYYILYGMMGVFFNELFEWIVMEVMCSFVLMKYREDESQAGQYPFIY